jgi:hypothetical protein
MKRICVLALAVIGALLLVEAPSWGKDVASCFSNPRHPVTRCHVAHRNLGVKVAEGKRLRKRRPSLSSIPVPPPANWSRDIPVTKGSVRQLNDFGQGQSRDPSGNSGGQALSVCLTCPNLVQGFPERTLLADQKPRAARLVDSSAPRAKAARGGRMGYHNNSYGMIVGGNIYDRLESTIYSPGFGNSRFYYGTDPDPRIAFELRRDPSYERASSSRAR